MSTAQWSLLYIEDKSSRIDSDTPALHTHFKSVDKAGDHQSALKRIYINTYDFIVLDATINFRNHISFLKEIKQLKPDTEVIALAGLSDEDKVGHVIDDGINAFVLTADQFDQALEAIAQMDPHAKKKTKEAASKQ